VNHSMHNGRRERIKLFCLSVRYAKTIGVGARNIQTEVVISPTGAPIAVMRLKRDAKWREE